MSTDNNTPKRTIKKKFLAADKTGRAIKGVGGYVSTFLGGYLLSSGSKSDTESDDDNEEDEE